ncbi:PPE family protein [Mycobacterium tuberculosis GM 1503]|nr:PPE family protein [Mycobacterium tuberculosis GM 1503]
MDFGLLPPEINSGRMYTGPGPGPMLAAATAWDGLAVELHATAAGYASELSALTGAWSGPSSTSMASAAAPYVAWMSATAVHAELAGAQARLAIAAYEAAFAATVPPPVIAANRAQLMVLIATNIFGQNTPAIMMTEAQYMEMWAQDAAAMYGYAGSSATASRMTAFTEPPQTTNHGQLGAQSSAVAQTAATAAGGNLQSAFPQLLSAVPRALQGLALPTASQSASATPQWVTDLGNLSTFLGGAVTGPYTFPGVLPPSGVPYLLGIQSVLVTQNGQGVSALLGKIGGKPITGALAPLAEFALHTPILGSEGLGGGSVSAGIGRAGLVGKLSVPQGWTVAAPEIPSPAAALQATRLGRRADCGHRRRGCVARWHGAVGLGWPRCRRFYRPPHRQRRSTRRRCRCRCRRDLATEANIFVIPAMDD